LNQSRTICGVFPLFATTAVIGTLTKQGLVSMNASPIELDLVAEGGGNRQEFEVPDLWYTANPLLCVCTKNTLSGLWEWEGGSGATSLTTWTPTSSSEATCCSPTTPYCLLSYNGAPRLVTASIRLVF